MEQNSKASAVILDVSSLIKNLLHIKAIKLGSIFQSSLFNTFMIVYWDSYTVTEILLVAVISYGPHNVSL